MDATETSELDQTASPLKDASLIAFTVAFCPALKMSFPEGTRTDNFSGGRITVTSHFAISFSL